MKNNILISFSLGCLFTFAIASPHFYERGMHEGDYGKGYSQGQKEAYSNCNEWMEQKHQETIKDCVNTFKIAKEGE
jgi:hypothetical protein